MAALYCAEVSAFLLQAISTPGAAAVALPPPTLIEPIRVHARAALAAAAQ